MAGAPSSAAQVEARVSQVASWVLAGLSRAEIVAKCGEEFGVSASTADRYARRARGEVSRAWQGDADYRAALLEGRYDRLYGEALAAGDLRGALAATKALAGLYGLQRGRPAEEADPLDMRSFYAATASLSMREYARAMLEVLDDAQIEAVRSHAFSAGAIYDLGDVIDDCRRQRAEWDEAEALLELCVRDHETLGRGRTREELVRDGVMGPEALPDGTGLP